MSNLRQIVTNHVEQATLKEYYKSKYSSTPHNEMNNTVKFLRKQGAIDREVDQILRAFSEEVLEGSPDVKKRKIRIAMYNMLILACTIGIAYAINETAWVFVGIIALIQVVIQILTIRE